MTVHGLVLAAGAGRRMGGPKALLRDAAGTPFVVRAVSVLREGGCSQVTVVVGAAADEVRPLLTGLDVPVAVARDWAEGMGASLRTGLADSSLDDAAAVVVTLVDLPDVGATVVARLLAASPSSPAVLARAAYDGRPGHPVLAGRDHWAGIAGSARGDRGARDYLRAHPPVLVECGDLAPGRDVDTPDAM
jgi:CTP:molybdopterin cytidylyltransferase MocA